MSRTRTGLRAFSLIELLLSVFILAIGIISVSALFPAGIAQQQQSADDQVGPIIAEQAIGLLRSRVVQEDFGRFEEFGIGTDNDNNGAIGPGERLITYSTNAGSYVFRPAPGDWSWIRPGVIRRNLTGTNVDETGAIDIFSFLAQNEGGSQSEFCEFPEGISAGGQTLFGAPYNTSRTVKAPPIIVTQRERWWPSVPEDAVAFAAPQYAWDCMFRRSCGRIQVGIFVYRVVGAGGARKAYVSPADGAPAYPAAVINGQAPTMPPVPYRRTLAVASGAGLSTQAATSGTATGLQVPIGWQQPPVSLVTKQPAPFTTGLVKDGAATSPGGPGQGLIRDDFPVDRPPPVHQQWQLPGQWIIDNNGNVHRVMQGRRNQVDPLVVRFSAPVPRTQNAQVFDDYELRPVGNAPDPAPQGVRTLHFVPSIIDANGTQLVPVYATVRDL